MRNFQCGFCFKKFFTSGEAEFHIENCHPIDTLTNFKCEICDLQNEFLAIPPSQRYRISNRALPRWIKNQLELKRVEKRLEEQSIQEEEEERESPDVDFSDEKVYNSEFPSYPEIEVEKVEQVEQVDKKSYASIVQD